MRTVKKTSTGQAITGRCKFFGYVVGPDGTNAPTISIFDNTAASGTELAPTAIYVANGGLQGFMVGDNRGVDCDNGIHVEITVGGGGAVEVVVLYEGGA